MNNILTSMLNEKNPKDYLDYQQKLREVIQETILSSLSMTDFFKKAAFYGGTSIRIFHNLPRFSEDLDFSLLNTDAAFSWTPYFSKIQEVFESYGLVITLSEKEKVNITDTRSAFLKENTIQTISVIAPGVLYKQKPNPEESIKVKFEVDTNPPLGFNTAFLSISNPFYSDIRVFDLPSLFAGKIGAVLTRAWKSRVKGRDLFDFLFYIGKGVSPNLAFLENVLSKAKLAFEKPLTTESLKELLKARFNDIDYDSAKKDVIGFIDNSSLLDNWSYDYFMAALSRLK